MSYDIVGYTHSSGYCLCTDCEDGTTVDEGNESGFVFPIFEDAEFDSYPTCDHCNQTIEDVCLTDYGRELIVQREQEKRNEIGRASCRERV